jgi:chaperonin cofactor prefoldin
VARVSGDVEARLEKLDERLDTRIAELTRSVDAVNRRLDRLLEMQVELSARRAD